MRKILIDTNVYVAFKRNQTNIVNIFQNVDFIGLNLTVLAELYAGFKGGNQESHNRSGLEEFMNNPRVHFIKSTKETAHFYAHVFSILKKKGTPIPTNDIWIAASAMQTGLSMVSLDKHFQHIDGLMIWNDH